MREPLNATGSCIRDSHAQAVGALRATTGSTRAADFLRDSVAPCFALLYDLRRFSVSLVFFSMACQLGAKGIAGTDIAPLPPERQDHARPQDCGAWQDCRRLALEAAERGEFETFHDLAWRAVQKGPPADPQLMYLVARAQSLSGRPLDALVMIRRLAEKGVAVDAATNDDFRRVRALAGWPVVAKLLAPAPTVTPSPETASSPGITNTLRVAGARFLPGGMAYDAASARFLFGDRLGRKLIVISERTGQPQDLVREASAGFADVTAIEIDQRRGDLWVVSANDDTTTGSTTALHKLQLVSGRPLDTFPLALHARPARLSDVALTRDGRPVVLDSAGRRVFRLPSGARGFVLLAALEHMGPTSLAPADDQSIYIAHRDGLARIDPSTRKVSSVGAGDAVEMTGLTWIRAHRGSLVGMQAAKDGCRLVRLRLNRGGRRAVGLDVLEGPVSGGVCPPATIAGDDLYYMRDFVIRRVPLRIRLGR